MAENEVFKQEKATILVAFIFLFFKSVIYF